MEQQTPTISIIIPVYNAEASIDACLSSLEAQTFGNWEAVCVDDGSKDFTLKKLEEWRLRDPRIKVHSQMNSGPSAARNTALDAATGEIIMFLDCDDTYQPNACETVRDAFDDPRVDIMAFGANCIPVQAAPKHVRNLLSPHDESIEGFTPDVLFKKHAQPYIARIAIRRNFLNRNSIRFAPNIKLAEDTAFLFEAYPFARTTLLSSSKLYNYMMGGGSITHSLNKVDATQSKLNQHLAAISHILDTWRSKNMLGVCPDCMVEWILDFTLFDIARLDEAERTRYLKQLDRILADAYGDYALLPRKRAVCTAAHKVKAHDAQALFKGVRAKFAFVRFFIATRGLKQCLERFL